MTRNRVLHGSAKELAQTPSCTLVCQQFFGSWVRTVIHGAVGSEELFSSRNQSSIGVLNSVRVDTQSGVQSICLAFEKLLAFPLLHVEQRTLDQLQSAALRQFELQVRDYAPSRTRNQRHFELSLSNRASGSPLFPIFRGTYNAPIPSLFVPAWIDGELIEPVQTGESELRLWEKDGTSGLAIDLTRLLGSLIPPGGRMWLAYEQFGRESESIVETRKGLAARVPILATPISYMLYHANCWLAPRDWDIPEGGREGPRNVQGNKALDSKSRGSGAIKVRHEWTAHARGLEGRVVHAIRRPTPPRRHWIPNR